MNRQLLNFIMLFNVTEKIEKRVSQIFVISNKQKHSNTQKNTYFHRCKVMHQNLNNLLLSMIRRRYIQITLTLHHQESNILQLSLI